MAGGVVLPIVVAIIGLVAPPSEVADRRLRRLRVDRRVGAYRITTLVVHGHRPTVRLEELPVNASYPSGHTAASIAVYGGLALLLSSQIRNRALRGVRLLRCRRGVASRRSSRMYRGMHYPLDVVGGAVVGLGALTVLVFACRAAGCGAPRRCARPS